MGRVHVQIKDPNQIYGSGRDKHNPIPCSPQWAGFPTWKLEYYLIWTDKLFRKMKIKEMELKQLTTQVVTY